MPSPTYVVSKFTNSGFGDHLSCVFGAWWYAKNTGRTLVVDWRGSRFNPEPGKNCFFDIFAQTDSLGGVPLIADERVADLALPTPIYPDKWDAENAQGIDHVPHTAEEIAAMNGLVAELTPRPEPTVILNQHIHRVPPQDAMQALLNDLQFGPAITEAADAFVQEHWQDRPAIGIHIRHGNGENIGERASYWLDPLALTRQLRLNAAFDLHARSPEGQAGGQFHDNAAPSLTASPRTSWTEARLYREVAGRVKALRTATDMKDAAVFLCTDAKRVEEGLAAQLGTVSTYPKKMLDAGGGPLHQVAPQTDADAAGQGYAPVQSSIVFDMLIELELLRRTKALICIPSQFSVISRLELPVDRQSFLKPPVQNRLIAKLFRG